MHFLECSWWESHELRISSGIITLTDCFKFNTNLGIQTRTKHAYKLDFKYGGFSLCFAVYCLNCIKKIEVFKRFGKRKHFSLISSSFLYIAKNNSSKMFVQWKSSRAWLVFLVFCSWMDMLRGWVSYPQAGATITQDLLLLPNKIRQAWPAMSVMSSVFWVTDRKNQTNAVHMLNVLKLDLEVSHGLELVFRWVYIDFVKLPS